MSYQSLSPEEIAELVEREQPVIIDMRDQHTYNNDHIPGAQRADDALLQSLIRKKQFSQPIVVYCYHGHSSQDLSGFLANIGFENVINLEGGWQAWSVFQSKTQANTTKQLREWLKQNTFDDTDLNGKSENGMTPLMTASLKGDTEIVEELLKNEVNINLVNDDGNNALWFACVSENADIIKSLIVGGIYADNRNVNGATALIYAASAGKLQAVKELVSAGVSMEITTHDGFTAFHLASTVEILKFLKPFFTVDKHGIN